MILSFYNDDDRIKFLEHHTSAELGWYLWQDLSDTVGLRWWRNDDVLKDAALVIMEELHTVTWPEEKMTWSVKHYYVVRDWHKPFADAVTNRTQVLKEMKKKTPVKEEKK